MRLWLPQAMGYSSWAFASFIIILRVQVISSIQPRNNSFYWLCLYFNLRIAIWKRNIIVSVIAIGVWLGGLALNIRRTSHTVSCLYHGLIPCACSFKDLALVRSLLGILILVSTNWGAHKLQQADGTYNPILNSCIFLHTHNGIVNVIGILVVDVVLLLTMLIGLLRDARRSSIGIWKLLYQQVTVKVFSPSCARCWVYSSV